MAHHEIDLLLECGHIMVERIEATIFQPLQGEKRICPIDGKDTKISKVGTPYWMEDSIQETAKGD